MVLYVQNSTSNILKMYQIRAVILMNNLGTSKHGQHASCKHFHIPWPRHTSRHVYTRRSYCNCIRNENYYCVTVFMFLLYYYLKFLKLNACLYSGNIMIQACSLGIWDGFISIHGLINKLMGS